MMKSSGWQSIWYNVSLPFRNLSGQQRVLQIVRLCTSFITLVLMITLILLRGSTDIAYVARINCAQLDVAYGLYDSLRTSISDSPESLGGGELLPIDLGLTDSEISILTLYTKNQVANAPQYLLLGVYGWCLVDYETNLYLDLQKHDHRENLTTTCHVYSGTNLFDYRGLLSDNGLTIILAYAYQSTYQNDTVYDKSVLERYRRTHIVKIVTVVQLVTQAILFVATLAVYGNRGPAKDLSRIPTLTLNLVAVISMVAGLSMITMCSVITHDLFATQKEINEGMNSFGINMVMGSVFFGLMWTAFAFLCLVMFSWTVPLWCANPPVEYEDEDYAHDTSTLLEDDFVARPYQVTRQTRKKLRKSRSRLFDEPQQSEDTLEAERDGLSEVEETEEYEDRRYADNDDKRVKWIERQREYELYQDEQSESELRKLGEKMARKLSVRQIGRIRRPHFDLPERSETQQLLYSDNPFSNHQYPQELPKRAEVGELEGPSVVQTRSLSDPLLRTRINPEMIKDRTQSMKQLRNNSVKEKTEKDVNRNNNETFQSLNVHNPFDTLDDVGSVLDEQEMAFLDNNHFVNRLA